MSTTTVNTNSGSTGNESRRGSLGSVLPGEVKFGAYCDDKNQIKFYNCAPVKPRKESLTSADEKDIKVEGDEVFGVVCDEGNKIHYYNCAPIKQKKPKKSSPPPKPIKQIFNRLFKEGGATSGSDLSLSSIGSNSSSKNT